MQSEVNNSYSFLSRHFRGLGLLNWDINWVWLSVAILPKKLMANNVFVLIHMFWVFVYVMLTAAAADTVSNEAVQSADVDNK